MHPLFVNDHLRNLRRDNKRYLYDEACQTLAVVICKVCENNRSAVFASAIYKPNGSTKMLRMRTWSVRESYFHSCETTEILKTKCSDTSRELNSFERLLYVIWERNYTVTWRDNVHKR